jgi:hypothetical protein
VQRAVSNQKETDEMQSPLPKPRSGQLPKIQSAAKPLPQSDDELREIGLRVWFECFGGKPAKPAPKRERLRKAGAAR